MGVDEEFDRSSVLSVGTIREKGISEGDLIGNFDRIANTLDNPSDKKITYLLVETTKKK